MFFKVLGLIAASFTTLAFVPQAVKTIKTKDTSGLSFHMYLMNTVGLFLWLVYGIYEKDLPLIVANSISVVLAAIILYNKVRNMKLNNEK